MIWSIIINILVLQYTVLAQTDDAGMRIYEIFNISAVNSPARTPSSGERDCKCVEFYMCDINKEIITHGGSIFMVRTDGVKNECGDSYKLCCTLSNVRKTRLIPKPMERKGCGTRHPTGAGMMTTGDVNGESKFGEFPWSVEILYKYRDDLAFQYQCGGALIHPQAVLTAVHCVDDDNKQFLVRAGEWDRSSEMEILPHQDRSVKSVVFHPEYFSGGLYNNVAVVLLESPFELSNHIDVVCLPNGAVSVPPNAPCYLTGWGRRNRTRNILDIQKKVELFMVEATTCEGIMRRHLSEQFSLHSSFVCALGEYGNSACIGDGGSALVCPISGETDRYQQIGIASWGIGCDVSQYPGVYTNVPLLKHWIDDIFHKNKLDTESYTI